jgi:N-acyl-D-aspartate/D-glutamate deacylase
MPAQRLENAIPRMKRKGRLQEGSDADITVFDPEAIAERATYVSPARSSVGVRHVVVNGVLVLHDGTIVDGVAPGQWMPHPCSR